MWCVEEGCWGGAGAFDAVVDSRSIVFRCSAVENRQ